MALIKFSTPPTLAGLLFCLASAEGAGLFILPCYNVATRKRLQRLFCRPCNLYSQITKTVYRALQGLFLGFVPFYRRKYQTDTSGYNTTCTTLERITHAWTACTRYQIPPPRRTLYRSTQPPYYNNVYKGAPPVMDPCQTAQYIADHASPAGSAPTVCGSLASDTPGAPAEGSASPSAQGQPGGL